MSDKRGLHGKFIIARRDNKHLLGQKHHGCDYFVLDLTHDQHGIQVVRYYATLCREDRPQLSQEIFEKYGK